MAGVVGTLSRAAPAVASAVRVYLVTPGGESGRGGMGRSARYLAREWRARGHGGLEVVDSYGPGVRALMPAYFATALLRVATAAALGRADLLHVNMAERGSVLRKGLVVWLGVAFGVPVLVHCHGADFADWHRALGPARRRLVVATLRRAERVVVLGRHWRAFVVGELGLTADRVEVLPNAAPEPEPAGAAAPPGDAVDGRPVRLLFLGRLGDRKGVPELLRALADPSVRGLGWAAVLAGDGEVDRFRAEIEVLGLEDRVRVAGWVGEDEARRLLAASDVLVLPSRNEGLPVAVLEAMAHGLAGVATPVGAIPDAVVDGDTGLLVPPGDVRALAGALARVIADPALRRALGGRARTRFEAGFSLRAHADGLARIYAAVLAGHAGARGQCATVRRNAPAGR